MVRWCETVIAIKMKAEIDFEKALTLVRRGNPESFQNKGESSPHVSKTYGPSL
jgi:hypothetical protein